MACRFSDLSRSFTYNWLKTGAFNTGIVFVHGSLDISICGLQIEKFGHHCFTPTLLNDGTLRSHHQVQLQKNYWHSQPSFIVSVNALHVRSISDVRL